MKLTWYGHSCFLLESGEGSIVFDPYAPGSVPGWELPKLRADAVICSHGHRDHGWREGVALSGGHFTGSVEQLASFHDERRGALRGENTVTLVEADGVRAVHMGDIGCALTAEQIAALGRVDVLMIPVGGHYTVDAAGAWEITKALAPKIVIPMHYRGADFGYDVIGPVEPFLSLAGNVKKLDGMSYTVDLSDAPATVVFERA